MQKLYCYVDETGQDTQGDLFVVAVVIAKSDQDSITTDLELIEKATGKGRRKWTRASDKQQIDYIRKVLELPALKGGLNYAEYHDTTEYLPRTVLATAQALAKIGEDYRAVVFVDGLPKSQTRWFGSELRHLHIRTDKVRGVRKEENSALMRLADALAGFVRAALSEDKQFSSLLKKSIRNGVVREL